MAYLAWIASELCSATSFPKGNIIPQKTQRDEGQCVRWALRTPSGTLHAVTPPAEVANSRIVGNPEVILGPICPAVSCQLLISRITGNLGTGTHFSGNRVNQDLAYAGLSPPTDCILSIADHTLESF